MKSVVLTAIGTIRIDALTPTSQGGVHAEWKSKSIFILKSLRMWSSLISQPHLRSREHMALRPYLRLEGLAERTWMAPISHPFGYRF